jgi:hypothetical protein
MSLRRLRQPNGKRIRPQISGILALFLFRRAVVEPVVISKATLPELPEATTGAAGLKMHAAS